MPSRWTSLVFLLALVVPNTEASDVCFTAALNQQDHQDLWIREDGSYVSVNWGGDSVDWSDRGTWRRGRRHEYILTSDDNVRAIELPRLRIGVGLAVNLPLVPQLRARLLRFLDEHPERSFPDQQIRDLAVTGGECPQLHAYICAGGCSGPWFYHLNVSPAIEWPEKPITRKELQSLVSEIDAYMNAPAKNQFRVRVVRVAEYSIAAWSDSGVGWASAHMDIEQIRQHLTPKPFEGELNVLPGDPSIYLVHTECTKLETPPAP